MDLVLNNLQRLICYKTQLTNQNKSIHLIIDLDTNETQQIHRLSIFYELRC